MARGQTASSFVALCRSLSTGRCYPPNMNNLLTKFSKLFSAPCRTGSPLDRSIFNRKTSPSLACNFRRRDPRSLRAGFRVSCWFVQLLPLLNSTSTSRCIVGLRSTTVQKIFPDTDSRLILQLPLIDNSTFSHLFTTSFFHVSGTFSSSHTLSKRFGQITSFIYCHSIAEKTFPCRNTI